MGPIVLGRKSQLSPGMCQGYSGSPVTKENVPERNAAAGFCGKENIRKENIRNGKRQNERAAK